MFTYDDILKNHAYSCFSKPPEVPDDKLFIGEAEQLSEQANIQLLASKVQPVSKALIDPSLDNVENLGMVGDGQGIVSQDDFMFGDFALGNPYESGVK